MTIRRVVRRVAKWVGLALSIGVAATWAWAMVRGRGWQFYSQVHYSSGDYTEFDCYVENSGIDAGGVTFHPPVILREVDVALPPGNLEDMWARDRRRRFLLPSFWYEEGSGSLHFPPWLVLAAFAGSTAVLWWCDRRRILPGHCQKCGYNLTGNVSGRCSECGVKL